MSGPQLDKPGQCNARLFISDDHGDNTCTMRCQSAPVQPNPFPVSMPAVPAPPGWRG